MPRRPLCAVLPRGRVRGLSRIAAIDVGTVTTRLLVADVEAAGVREVLRSTDITHTGEGMNATGRLSEAAIARVAGVIAGYSRRVEELGVERVVAYATSASRDAENSDDFLRAVQDAGVTLEIISGSREAELSFLGATAERFGEGLLVVDCGGGSTELVLGDAVEEGGERRSKLHAARSVDVGSRRMTEMFFASDPPRRDEIEAARAWAAAEFRPYFDRLDERPSQMIALAGTATTLAAIKQEMAVYDSARAHGYVLAGSEVSDIFEMLATLKVEDRKRVVGLHPERAGVIVAGALILETVLALAGLESMVVSEHDILYGILLDTFHDLRE